MQLFKGDPTELKFVNSAGPILDELLADKSDFFANAYASKKMADLIYTMGLDPVAAAMTMAVYRTIFTALQELADKPATFESWIAIFKNIYTEAGVIRFVVPGPGQLQINVDGYVLKTYLFGIEGDDTIITESGDELIFNSLVPTIDITLFDWLAPQIVSSVITQNEIMEEGGAHIAFQTYDPVLTQAAANQFIFQFSAAGVYTTVSLNLI